jgi:signal-transduction protein with cAMP-binding, CBS, and nucleotidyltransferase domain
MHTDIMEELRKSTDALKRTNTLMKDIEKESTEVKKLKDYQDKKKQIFLQMRGLPNQEGLRYLWGICHEQVKILENDLFLSEIDREEIAYAQAREVYEEKLINHFMNRKEGSEISRRERSILKHILIYLKMYYLLIKEEMQYIMQQNMIHIKDSEDTQDNYMKKLVDYARKDVEVIEEKKRQLSKVLTLNYDDVFSIKRLIKPIKHIERVSSSLAKILYNLKEEGTSSIVVYDYSQIPHIIKINDVIKRLYYDKKNLDELEVTRLLKSIPYVKSDATIMNVMDAYLKDNSEEIYVVENNQLVGFVDIQDCMKDIIIYEIKNPKTELNYSIHDIAVSQMRKSAIRTINAHETVATGIEELYKADSDVILIQKSNVLLGHITLKDIFTKCIISNRSLVNTQVHELMNEGYLSFNNDEPFLESFLLMMLLDASHMIVSEGKMPTGIITVRDIIERQRSDLYFFAGLIDRESFIKAKLLTSEEKEIILLSLEGRAFTD